MQEKIFEVSISIKGVKENVHGLATESDIAYIYESLGNNSQIVICDYFGNRMLVVLDDAYLFTVGDEYCEDDEEALLQEDLNNFNFLIEEDGE